VRYSIRSLCVFERLAGQPFEVRTLTDTYLFFYSMLLANNPDCGITFEDFVSACDADRSLPEVFTRCMDSAIAVNRQFPEEKEVKKKRAR
jgi:hypothetical protein